MRTITIIFMLMFLLGGTHIGLAEESTDPDITSSSTATTTQSGQPALSAAAQNRITKLIGNVNNQLNAYIGRITNITDRLETRADKLAAAGFDMTATRARISGTRQMLNAANSSLLKMDKAVADFVISDNPRTYWPTVKTTYQETLTSIKSAHLETLEILLLLQTAHNPTPTATTTDTMTNNPQ